jgi:hypothetical protein
LPTELLENWTGIWEVSWGKRAQQFGKEAQNKRIHFNSYVLFCLFLKLKLLSAASV